MPSKNAPKKPPSSPEALALAKQARRLRAALGDVSFHQLHGELGSPQEDAQLLLQKEHPEHGDLLGTTVLHLERERDRISAALAIAERIEGARADGPLLAEALEIVRRPRFRTAFKIRRDVEEALAMGREIFGESLSGDIEEDPLNMASASQEEAQSCHRLRLAAWSLSDDPRKARARALESPEEGPEES